MLALLRSTYKMLSQNMDEAGLEVALNVAEDKEIDEKSSDNLTALLDSVEFLIDCLGKLGQDVYSLVFLSEIPLTKVVGVIGGDLVVNDEGNLDVVSVRKYTRSFNTVHRTASEVRESLSSTLYKRADSTARKIWLSNMESTRFEIYVKGGPDYTGGWDIVNVMVAGGRKEAKEKIKNYPDFDCIITIDDSYWGESFKGMM